MVEACFSYVVEAHFSYVIETVEGLNVTLNNLAGLHK